VLWKVYFFGPGAGRVEPACLPELAKERFGNDEEGGDDV
jgi:hypothetical protein